ncbi:hypothetical protein HHI36_002469 [Cryptolaemus montrouzieri]|uniref:FP protein C-terminal domain-containing protein n=1 Tax=Cryptolaemus montrouzieri TaxID=559131 RepID=A0ABD2PB66_9CUCU
MIDSVYRVQTQNKNKPKNIIINFLTQSVRDNVLAAARAVSRDNHGRRGFSQSEISEGFFVNEHLPPDKKNLLKEVKEKNKEINKCKYIWVQNSNILARKTDNSKIVYIAKLDDFDSI